MVMRTFALKNTVLLRNNLHLVPLRSASVNAAKSQQASHQQTYGEVFNTPGRLRDKPITPEDAARMRSLKSQTLGANLRGGTAAKMQSAVDKSANVTNADDVAETGLPTVDEVVTPGAFMSDVDIDVGMTAPPATGRVDVVDHPITIGEALEVAGENIGDKPMTDSDARVIQSAETRATGNAPGVKRILASEAQAAAFKNATASTDSIPTVHDVLQDSAAKMQMDKVVTHEDAARVQAVEQSRNAGVQEPGGISATLQSAADKNAASDFEPRTGTAGRIPNQ